LLVHPERLGQPGDALGEAPDGVDRSEAYAGSERQEVRRRTGSAGVAAHRRHGHLIAVLRGDLYRAALPDLLHRITVVRYSADRLLDETLPLAGLCSGYQNPLAHDTTHTGVEEVGARDRERLLARDLVDELDREPAVLPVPGDDFAVLALKTRHPEHLRLMERVPSSHVCDKLLPSHA